MPQPSSSIRQVSLEVAQHAAKESMDALLRITGAAPAPDLCVILALVFLHDELLMLRSTIEKRFPEYFETMNELLAKLDERRAKFVETQC